MLRLLTLASVAGFAAAAKCSTFTCTDAIAGGVQAADVQTQKTGSGTVDCACGGTCTDADRRVCCTPADTFWINAAGKSMADGVPTPTCDGKVGPGDNGAARLVAATDIANALCTPCVSGPTWSANGADCAAVTAFAACTANNLDGTARLAVSADGTANNVCTGCVAGTSFGLADGSANCAAGTSFGPADGST